MKKLLIAYVAGIVTVLAVVGVAKQISKQSVLSVFSELSERKHDHILSTFETEHWAFIETEYKNEDMKNFTRGRYGHRSYYLRPKDTQFGYVVCLELDEQKLKKVWVAGEGKKQVVVGINDENDLGNASIYGTEYVSMDKNLNGLWDLQSEGSLGNRSKMTYFTSEGEIHKEFGQPLVDETTGKTYKLNWTGSDWEKEYVN